MLAGLRTKLPGGRSAERAPPAGPFRLEVRRGGEPLFEDRFEDGEFLIGSSPAADVIVTDLLQDEAVLLRFELVGVAGMIFLTPLSSGVQARGGELGLNRTTAFSASAQFRVDGFEFSATFDPPNPRIAAPGSLPVILLCGALVAGLAAVVSGSSEPRPASGIDPATVEVAAPSETARSLDAESELRYRLIAANLAPPVRVDARGDRLFLSGMVSADERARVLDLLAMTRARIARPIEIELTSNLDVIAFVSSIVLAPEAYLVGRDNKRYEVGQRLPDGAMLKAIDETGLLIDRDGIDERVGFSR